MVFLSGAIEGAHTLTAWDQFVAIISKPDNGISYFSASLVSRGTILNSA